MNTAELCKRLLSCSDGEDIIAVAARIIQECQVARYVTEDRKVRPVIGTLPLTADGHVIGHGGCIHGLWDDGEPGWTGRSTVLVDTEDYDRPRYGRFYSSREAVEAARNGGGA